LASPNSPLHSSTTIGSICSRFRRIVRRFLMDQGSHVLCLLDKGRVSIIIGILKHYYILCTRWSH
jgi:hypothetical protein